MIAVIADDFTGAAEIGGLGLRHGLTVEIETEIINAANIDLLIIAADTRSMKKEDAFEEVYKITKQLLKFDIDWFYKKTDSVMRGHILDETIAVLSASGKDRALLIPSNPSFGRRVSNGIYYINNQYLHETGFSKDPEFALNSSNVLELLGSSEKIKSVILKPNEDIPNGSIAIGDAENIEDLNVWAKKINNKILPAGAAGFFSSLLETKGIIKKAVSKKPISLKGRSLYVCGSSFSLSRQTIITERQKLRKSICEMPYELFNNSGETKKLIEQWVNDVLKTYEINNYAIVAINQPIILAADFAKRLRELTALLVEKVLDKISIQELFIEGGATTSAIVNKINIKKFIPVQEIAPGVIRMRIEDKSNMYLTIKPGSYPWPTMLWNNK